MTGVAQAVPAPATRAEFERIKPQLIDTHGNLAVSDWCDDCRCTHFTVEPHLADVPCPHCGSSAGSCKRPSGHDAQGWHSERVDAYTALCDVREAAGLPQIAPWARG
jgi:hypothetical protein